MLYCPHAVPAHRTGGCKAPGRVRQHDPTSCERSGETRRCRCTEYRRTLGGDRGVVARARQAPTGGPSTSTSPLRRRLASRNRPDGKGAEIEDVALMRPINENVIVYRQIL